MYQALYRKYRPQTFEEVIGQKPVITTLVNQIKMGKIGHAYLFCGSRGTGKTSTAKIFARAINCQNNKDGLACGKCDACLNLARNNMDILEIDAASNNGVDEIRDLREKVKYPPVIGRYKVYIVDEVHMLSPSAFNALLKTLEEPPSHAVFILATTEVHKLPATILSRCLRFDFGLVALSELEELLKRVFKNECIKAEENAIEVIARAGEGSVRDTLSIADRCISYSGENLTYDSVMEVLSITGKDKLFEIAGLCLSGNMGEAMLALDKVLSGGKSPLVLSKDLISYLRDLLVVETLKDGAKTMVVASEDMFKKMLSQATEENFSKVISLITNLSSVESELRYSNNPRIVLETALIRAMSEAGLLERVEKLEKMLLGGQISAPENKRPSSASLAVKAPEIIAEKETEQAQDIKVQGNILGKLLCYLRDRKEMALLASVRQVTGEKQSGKTVIFSVDDKMTLDLISRDKYRLTLSDFFDTMGLSYKFVVEEQKSSGDIGALSSFLGGKLEVDD